VEFTTFDLVIVCLSSRDQVGEAQADYLGGHQPGVSAGDVMPGCFDCSDCSDFGATRDRVVVVPAGGGFPCCRRLCGDVAVETGGVHIGIRTSHDKGGIFLREQE